MTESLYRRTTGLCATCRRSVPAEVWRVGDGVVLRKLCDDHGLAEVTVSPSAAWYERVMALAPALRAPASPRATSQGCPFDCGPCTSHEQEALLPIVPITSACNLDCPICYTHNRNQGAYQMSEAELRAVLGHIARADPERRIINLTGGEPTLHPDIVRLVELCAEEGVHRITLSTHGLRFLKEDDFLPRLAAAGARIILSFDSLDEETNRRMLGGPLAAAKREVLARLDAAGVPTTLLPVLARGHNDHEVGALVELGLATSCVRSIELHTMTFTGHGGLTFDRAGRYTTYEVLRDLEAQTAGRLRVDDFVPSPAAHPLCYLVTYVLALPDGRWLPLPRFLSTAELRAVLAGGLYLEPSPALEACLHDVVSRLWAGAIELEPGLDAATVLGGLRALVDEAFAAGAPEAARMAAAERRIKAVYVHAHMDEETFDTDRIRQCCVGIREPDGRSIPSCAYNVLYRDRDARFSERPSPPLLTLGRGRRPRGQDPGS
ncbi:MAG TPA: radical SAM protein [Kofleriaceae bacterium]|nr:radical SAM protein [Kofleriaceae bacterium]